MNQTAFADLLAKFAAAATAGDGAAFAACFTEDAIYHDYVYGDHDGRADICEMLEGRFHKDATAYHWEMRDPVINGDLGYAWSLSTFRSTIPEFQGQRVVIDGMSRFELRDGLIADYREQVNAGVAMAQLGVAPERMGKVFNRWAGNLRDEPVVQAYLADHGQD